MATIIGNDFSDLQAATLADFDARTRRKAAQQSFLAALSGIMAENRRTDAERDTRYNDARVRELLGMGDIGLRGRLGDQDAFLRGRDIDLRGELGRGRLTLDEKLGMEDIGIRKGDLRFRENKDRLDRDLDWEKLMQGIDLGYDRNDVEREKIKTNPLAALGAGSGGIINSLLRDAREKAEMENENQYQDAVIDDRVARANALLPGIIEKMIEQGEWDADWTPFIGKGNPARLLKKAAEMPLLQEEVSRKMMQALYGIMDPDTTPDIEAGFDSTGGKFLFKRKTPRFSRRAPADLSMDRQADVGTNWAGGDTAREWTSYRLKPPVANNRLRSPVAGTNSAASAIASTNGIGGDLLVQSLLSALGESDDSSVFDRIPVSRRIGIDSDPILNMPLLQALSGTNENDVRLMQDIEDLDRMLKYR